MIALGKNKTLVIHFDERRAIGCDSEWEGAAAGAESGRAGLVVWYCTWACERAHSVFVLLPEQLKVRLSRILPKHKRLTPVWYTDDGVSSLPRKRGRGQVWVINGSQLPLVDWRAAGSAVRTRRSNVTVFGSSGPGESDRYHETVDVGDAGEVMKFKRHYCDSPIFADPWSGEASFMAASDRYAPAVVNHVVARGWGLDSIGALTRRFSVQWAPHSCVLAELDSPSATVAREYGGGADRQLTGTSGTCAVRNPGDAGVQSVDVGASQPDEFTLELTYDPGRSASGPAEGGNGNGRNGQNRRTIPAVPPVRHGVASRTFLFTKRAIDIVASASGLILLSPLLLIVAAMIKCTSRGPVMFGHVRQGLGGKEFPCWKFRSMLVGADALQAELRAKNEVDGPQFKMTDDPRLTKLGKWLRSSNIDELPQLLNVLVGQMSLVGPRPSPDKENQLCPAWRRARLSVKPGITGLWQVLRLRDSGKSDFQEWIYYDIEYARRRSLWLDLQILLYTPVAMFAPSLLAGFVGRLERRGVCRHSTKLR